MVVGYFLDLGHFSSQDQSIDHAEDLCVHKQVHSLGQALSLGLVQILYRFWNLAELGSFVLVAVMCFSAHLGYFYDHMVCFSDHMECFSDHMKHFLVHMVCSSGHTKNFSVHTGHFSDRTVHSSDQAVESQAVEPHVDRSVDQSEVKVKVVCFRRSEAVFPCCPLSYWACPCVELVTDFSWKAWLQAWELILVSTHPHLEVSVADGRQVEVHAAEVLCDHKNWAVYYMLYC